MAQGEKGVDALAERTEMSIANTSQHLQNLRRAGLVLSRRDGKSVLYRIADDGRVVELLNALRRVAEENMASVDRIVSGYFADRDGMEPMTRVELLERANSGLVTILDVRPMDEFSAGHVPGAINIPLQQLQARLQELDETQEIVAYCRGAYCVLSFEAVAALRSRGFNARRLEEGMPEWRAAGLTVEG
ncbi:ArsR/SmtB family transcription factor [Maritalea sp.]|uniref:ArsR/SmtB family transcription factor n=1 Tax=Maritalea sp. TaxID=2003361 RepID=UPI0039E4DEE9